MKQPKAFNRPLVSIILPTYNRENLISCSIKSVLQQSYADFELIVVDDASEDDTGRIDKEFGDIRIRYVRHEYNKGCGAARNRSIELSRGNFIAFQDSDDEWLPEKLEKHMRIFQTILSA